MTLFNTHTHSINFILFTDIGGMPVVLYFLYKYMYFQIGMLPLVSTIPKLDD